MKISENWLRQWVNPAKTAEEIGEQLTMAGLELDGLSKIAPDFSAVVVGQVLSLAPHPDADRLKIASVDVGEQESLQIVCGASNVANGMKIPVALVGAVLPATTKTDDRPWHIKKSKLRGVESAGMLCAGAELGIDDGIDGLLILPDDAPIGENLREYLHLDGHIFDIAITPNRGDCLSVRGIARELALLNHLPFVQPFTVVAPSPEIEAVQAVQVLSPCCPRYLAQVLSGVNGSQPAPDFIRQHLFESGIRPKNLLVDVTNFVLLELGQPLHAFDKEKLVGAITVRLAQAGETLELLNDQMITLAGDELVIADDMGAIALAGIMGGKRTAISDVTTAVVLESAFFDPLAIAGRARRFGLHTDASQRFERGVDFELPSLALAQAAALLVQYGGARAGQITICDNKKALPKREPIVLPFASIEQRLGVAVDKETALGILNQLQIATQDAGDTLIATPPSHRFDVSEPVDLIEELARIIGYDNIENRLPTFGVVLHDSSQERLLLDLKRRLVGAGYFEAICLSFSDVKTEALFDDDTSPPPLALANPISSDLAVMRRTLLSGLLPCVQYNIKRQATRVRLFETGLTFVGKTAASAKQQPHLAWVATGGRFEPGPWRDSAEVMDFYALKGDVERLLPERCLKSGQMTYQRSRQPFLHPGQSADVLVNGQCLGFFGQLHPDTAQALDLPTTWVAELNLPTLLDLYAMPTVKTPSKFPSVRRDLAFIMDKDVLWQDVWALVRQAAGDKLVDGWLFDYYDGENAPLPLGKKSLAFAMVWQDDEATFSDDAIRQRFDAVIAAVSTTFNAKLRDGE